jgi:nucleotide-binding universal stress UspA family protein
MTLTFRKILVPVDFSEAAGTAVEYAQELARHFKAELHLLHVREDSTLVAGWPMHAAGAVQEMGEEAAPLHGQLDRLIPPDKRSELSVAAHVVIGQSAGVAIARYALDGDFDLIVMGTHGRSALAHALMGSVAEKVVQSASCPVLTIRHPTHKKMAADRLRAAPASPLDR